MRIGVLDDDPAQLALIESILKVPFTPRHEDITCVAFSKGEQLRRALRRETFDLLILDWNVPDLDGLDLLKWLRAERRDFTPVLILSARTAERDVASALFVGADDYVIKPFRPLEFRARLARLYARSAPVPEKESMRFGAWEFDRSRNLVTYRPTVDDNESPVAADVTALTESEFKLALALFRNMGKPVSRAYLVEKAGYQGDDTSSRTLDSHIYRLRGKLGLNGQRSLSLLTVYGQGYRLEASSPQQG